MVFCRSTDFQVHRNWLAITNSLPISKWYYEKTSQWTLDYPPFFAWLEFLLSQFASLVDSNMTKVENLGYASVETVIFQRLSVIAADLVLLYAGYQYYCYKNKSASKLGNSYKPQFVCILFILNFGLIIVDHIHFQYNGFLFGILILSITRMFENEFLWSAFWYSVLVNFKHIYLYIAPAYFVYLLKRYCFKHPQGSMTSYWLGVNIRNLLPFQLMKLGFLVISVFSVSFGPFIALGQLQQVLQRLFPFKRGLCHAYWAPNFWALYNVVDKILATIGSKLGLENLLELRSASMTGGLVRHSQHAVLPSVSPLVTLVLTLLAMMPCLINLWIKRCNSERFLKAIVLCAYCSFIFGWHVHEKAVLLITIPLSLLSLESRIYARIFVIVSTAGNLSLFPLLFQRPETPIKVILMLLYTSLTFWAVTKVFCSSGNKPNQHVLRWYENIYLFGLIPLEIYNLLIHSALGFDLTLPFLPLLLTSVYCSVGILWSWLLFYYSVLTEGDHDKVSID
ncbi:probable dolichyl pyrophosphate Glc1Man9GlcNAc2 alpha-1,3-glucosyltransferase isoform X2 [Dendronephthya gigantea]|uniref:probable dolichyl pyrophosphate Glc1Man9GlcNAc2 alpha-1,3-glucosyltransferase isoform X2 n=1 Tax=Dendronephthya gigantea TaxID=151771 RepID=UPI00106C74CD|nr:probable dolichyl pyrophosphate Glc1Man9GlcNAc2 alpha-1,3-glucosyltransferase isoform X2 [Dendronephthya gigantea]